MKNEVNRTFSKVKKNFNFNFKSSFYEKLKLFIIPVMLLTLGVGQMWAL